MTRPYLLWTVSVLAGLAVGAVAFGASPSPETPHVAPAPIAPLAEVQPPLVLPAQCDGRKVVLDAEAIRLQNEISVIDLQAGIAEQRRLRREGVEQPWPEKPDPLQVPDALRSNLEDALAATGTGHLIGMDCEEYPCIVAIGSGRTAEQEGGITSATFSPLFDALNERGYEDHEALFYTATGVHDTDTLFLAVTGPDAPNATRTSFRGERYVEEVLAQIADDLEAGGEP